MLEENIGVSRTAGVLSAPAGVLPVWLDDQRHVEYIRVLYTELKELPCFT